MIEMIAMNDWMERFDMCAIGQLWFRFFLIRIPFFVVEIYAFEYPVI